MNFVNESNFNETMKGYLVRACKYSKLSKEQVDDILNSLRFAIDDMTMEDARKEYDLYCSNEIRFK